MNGKTNKKEFLTITEACNITGLNQQTLRVLAEQQKVACYKTPAGHRRFNKQSLVTMCSTVPLSPEIPEDKKLNYIYTRVSSKKQMDDLSRQIEYIKHRRTEYTSYILISDIASGINFQRKGFNSILESCLQGNIGEVVIAHRDRLCRFGFDLVKFIIEKAGGKITVIDDEQHKSTEQELAEDLLSIIHIYSCRQMGKRKYKKRESKIIKDTVETDNESSENC
jgi:predicted site-specific integrase-resolvase